MNELIRVDNQLFVGRVEEQKQFRAALQETLDPSVQEELPYICIVYGDGGMGKTSLIRRFRDIAFKEAPFAGQFQLLWVDWEDERKKFPSLQVGRNQIGEEIVFRTLHVAASREKWGRQFASYRKALQQREEAAKRVAEVLAGDNSWDEAGVVRSLGVDVLAKIIRLRLPMIGDVGEELVETFLEAGIEVGADQAVKLRTTIENHLRAALKTHHFNYFLNPQEQLALAVARGLNRVARQQRLIIVLDSYELVDRADVWMRVVVRAAGDRVMWIISDRHNLLHSRQFGREYFKGYADDFPRRLLGFQMRPLAIPHIHTYFQTRVPDRPLSLEETEAISRVTRGIPLAVREAAEIWEAGASLNEIIGGITVSTPGSQIVQKMTDRYLQHVVLESDRMALFALALAHGDVEVLRGMLQPVTKESKALDLEELLRRLERDYASVHAAHARLHDDPGLFFREYLKEPIRRTSKRVRYLNERAVTVIRERLAELEEELVDLDDRCRDDNWVQAVLSLTHYLFWLDEKAAWQWLIPRFVEGMVYNRDLQNGLIHVVDEWQGHLTEKGEHILQVLRTGDKEEQKLLKMLRQLRERGWLGGPGETERDAILDLRTAARLYREGQVEEALALYRQVEEGLSERQETLRRQLAAAYENLARRLLAEGAEREHCLATAHSLLEQVVSWFPEQQPAWYTLGLIREESGARQEAAVAFQRVMELADEPDSQYQAVAQRLGDLQRELGQIEEARVVYKALLDVAPTDRNALTGMGVIYSIQGEDEKAQAAFEAAVADIPPEEANLEALLGLGQIYLRQRRDDEAQTLFQQVLVRASQHSVACRDLGEAAYRLGQLDSALTHFREATVLDPQDAAAHCGLARVYHRGLGQHQPAQVSYQRALTTSGHTTPVAVRIEALVGLGDIHRVDRRYESALAAYDGALKLDGELVAAHEGRARVYRALGRYEQALQAHEAALSTAARHTPDYAFAYDNLGAVYLALGHYQEAATTYEQALTLNGKSAPIYVGLGDARLGLGQVDAADEAYRRALATSPLENTVHAAALKGTGAVLASRGRLTEATDAFNKALALTPEDAECYLYLADVQAREERSRSQEGASRDDVNANHGEAEATYQRAAALAPEDARPHARLGALYHERRQPAAAWAAYQKALTLDPSLTAAHVGLGRLLARAGRDEEALKSYHQALEVKGGTGVLPQQVATSRAEAHCGLGDLYRRQARRVGGNAATQAWLQALAAYRQASEVAPHDARAFIGLGEAYQALSHPAEAETAFHQALAAATLQDDEAAQAHHGLGRLYQAQDEPEKAEAALRKAVHLSPKWSAPLVGLGVLLAAQGRPEEAVVALEQVLAEVNGVKLKEHETVAFPFQILGDQYLLLERYEEAAGAYSAVLDQRLQPSRLAQVRLGLGEATRALGRKEEAETAYRQALEGADGDLTAHEQVRAYLGLATLYTDAGRYTEAEVNCRSALALSPDNEDTAEAYQRLGAALAGQKQYTEAESAYQKGLQQVPAPARAAAIYTGLAYVKHALGRYKEALQACEEAQKQVEDWPVDTILGVVYAALGEEEAAETTFQEVLLAAPRDEEALNGLGTLYHQRGEYEKALPYFQRAIRLHPRAATPYVGLGRVHAALENTELASAAFRKALQAPDAEDTDLAAAHNGLGALHSADGAHRLAARAHRRALATASGGVEHFTAAAGLGDACLALEAWEEAADAYQQAVNIATTTEQSCRALLGLGAAQAARSRLAASVTAYERALSLQPENADTSYQLAQVYATLGRHEEALQAYHRSLALDPEPAGTRSELYLYLGRSALALGQFEEALQAYEKASKAAVAVDEDNAQASLYLFGGDLYLALGRYDEGLAAYQATLDLATTEQSYRLRAAVGLGHTYYALEEYQKAELAYRRALEHDSEYAEAHGGLGATYVRLGEYAAGARAYEKALVLAPENAPYLAEYHAGLADAYTRLGRIPAAQASYERALGLDPQMVSVYEALGRLLLEQSEPQRSLSCLSQALELDPARASAHEATGRVYLALESYALAATTFEEALGLAPELGSAHEGLGYALQGLRQPAAALSALEEARLLGVDNPQLYEALAVLYVPQQPDKALAALETALDRGGVKASIYAQMGVAYEALGEDQEAFKAYQQALKLDHELPAAHCGLGNIQRRRNNDYDALVAYRNALQVEPGYALAYYGMARVYDQMGRIGEAVTTAQRAMTLTVESSSILLYLAGLYRRQGNLQAALEAYNQLLLEEEGIVPLLAAEKAAALSGRGAVYVERGEWQLAQADFEQALVVEPDHAAALAGLGDVHMASQRWEAAQAAFEQALDLDPDRSRSYTSLGNLYVLQNKIDEALNAYQQAIALDPRDPAARTGLGDAYRALQRTDEALAAYQRAIRLNPSQAAPYLGQGYVYRSLGRPYEALRAFQQTVNAEPQLPAYLGMGELFLEWGHLTEALDAYEAAISMSPTSAAAYLGLGNVLRDQAAYEEAVAAYEEAQALVDNPELAATIQASLADVYKATGRLEEAVGAYRQAIELRPDDALSHGSLAGLYRRLNRTEAFEEAMSRARELMAEESEYNRACLEAISGEAEQAVLLLQIALQKRQVDPNWVRQDPDFDFVREHPEFQALLHTWLPGEFGVSESIQPSI